MHSINIAIKEEDRRESSPDKIPEVWKCGEPYRFPLPAPDGDPWQILLTPILEKDKARCDAWKDEVQNLLIFAGLFSAVVTAFIIETYKGLQQDPSSVAILLLSRIAFNLENPLNDSSVSIPVSMPAFSPSPSIVRVNIFLFVSLILSLTTVLIGIVSLQWLREHQAHTGSFTPQNTFAAVHMRSEALEKWRVPEIFSALPLILQCALILFFIGIIDFLLDINVWVVIPVALVIGLTLVFLLLTTMLPTLQAFILHHPNLKLNNQVPVQCPYKSPQSRAFRRLITSSRLVFLATSLSFATVYWMIMRLCLLPGRMIKSHFYRSLKRSLTSIFDHIYEWPSRLLFKLDQRIKTLLNLGSSERWNGFDYMTRHIYSFWSVKTSFDFDLVWLSIRDNYFQSTCSQESWLYQNRFDQQEQGAIYDAVCGLCEELTIEDVNMNADFESPIFTAYHCALDSSVINRLPSEEQINAARTRNAYLTTLLGYDQHQMTPLDPFPNVLQHAPLDILWEEKGFVLLNIAYLKLYDSDISSPRLSRHLAEVSFRLLGYLYSHPHLTSMSKNSDGPPELPFSAEVFYIMKIFDDQDQPFTTQWALTIDLYFRAFDGPDSLGVDFKSNFHAHPFIREYIWYFWKEVDHEFSRKSIHSDTLKQIICTFHLIGDILKSLLQYESGHLLECIFYPAALYIQSCRQLLPDHDILNQETDALIPTLARCKNSVTLSGTSHHHLVGADEYDEDKKIALFSEEWWGVLFRDRASYHSGSSKSRNHKRNSRSMEIPTVHHTAEPTPSRSGTVLSE